MPVHDPRAEIDEPRLAAENIPPISVIDFIMTLVENALLILGATALGMAVGYGALKWYPVTYTSSALLQLNDPAAELESIIRSPVVLDIVIAKFPDLFEGTPEARRRLLNSKLKWGPATAQPRPKANLFLMEICDQQPRRAQALVQFLIETWLDVTKPKPDTRARLEDEIQRSEAQLLSTSLLLKRFETEVKTLLAPNSLQGELSGSLLKLINERATMDRILVEKKEALRGISRDVIISQPTLPVEPGQRASVWILLGGAFCAGLATIFALLRMLLRHARLDPVIDAKFNRLRKVAANSA